MRLVVYVSYLRKNWQITEKTEKPTKTESIKNWLNWFGLVPIFEEPTYLVWFLFREKPIQTKPWTRLPTKCPIIDHKYAKCINTTLGRQIAPFGTKCQARLMYHNDLHLEIHLAHIIPQATRDHNTHVNSQAISQPTWHNRVLHGIADDKNNIQRPKTPP